MKSYVDVKKPQTILEAKTILSQSQSTCFAGHSIYNYTFGIFFWQNQKSKKVLLNFYQFIWKFNKRYFGWVSYTWSLGCLLFKKCTKCVEIGSSMDSGGTFTVQILNVENLSIFKKFYFLQRGTGVRLSWASRKLLQAAKFSKFTLSLPSWPLSRLQTRKFNIINF